MGDHVVAARPNHLLLLQEEDIVRRDGPHATINLCLGKSRTLYSRSISTFARTIWGQIMYISISWLHLLARAKSFGISRRKNEKKNSPAHDFRPNLHINPNMQQKLSLRKVIFSIKLS